MKDFFKYVGATVVGILLFFIVIGIISMMSIVGMISGAEATKTVSNNSVLVLNMSGSLEEQSNTDAMSFLTGGGYEGQGLCDILSAIAKAKENENIKGIYIEAGALSADFAQLQEIRNALSDFKKSGKWIVSYGDTYTQGMYYLASVGDKVWLNPEGMVDWHGLGSQPLFVKDLLAKFGVKMNVIKVGKYKSATEMFTEDKMSAPNREQTEAYLNSLWGNVCKDVSKSRGISVELLNQYADSLLAFTDQKQLVKMKMVDNLVYAEQVKSEIKKLLKIDEDKRISQVSATDMTLVKQKKSGDQVAVYYAYGTIVDTPVQGLAMGGGHQIVSKTVCRDLEDLMNDDDVKAVVIRVNSPGGSAYASEQIWHQIELMKAKKPVVVSMGGYAASGGYYISSGANYIFAEPTTITGSIGIYGQFPDASQLVTQKLGVKFDEVKTNKHSTFGSYARPMSNDEISLLTKMIQRGYNTFRQRVATGRKMTTQQVEELAQGHVFTGEKALQLKLVDELGGLDKAVAKAASLAKIKECYTADYPAPPSLLDQLMPAASGSSYLNEQLRLTLGEYYEPFMMLKTINQSSAIQARMPYFLNIK